MVYDAGGVSAVWSIGAAFVKVKIIDESATREHVTLHYIRQKGRLSFAIPDVYYHAEFDGRYYLVIGRVAGQTLNVAWPTMDEATKQFCVDKVATICKELALWQGGGVHGVDDRHLCDHYLSPSVSPIDCSPQGILRHFEDLGLECSSFYFYHCDLGPGNALIDTATNSIGIIDWETAGFVPKEWIRTKFRISGGMDFSVKDMSASTDWRSRVQIQLEKEGFPEIAKQWMARRAKAR